jgi:hypothetical protein
MALTFTADSSRMPTVNGDRRVWRGQVTFDSGYPAGGEAVTAADFGLAVEIESMNIGSVEGDPTVKATWDPSASKIALQEEDATSGISVDFATTDASAVIVTVDVTGY